MESQPQNPEFGINPENFHPCTLCAAEIVFPHDIDNRQPSAPSRSGFDMNANPPNSNVCGY